MSSINFDNPWLLLIAPGLALLLAIPFFIAVGKDNRNFHNITSGILHVVIAILVAFSTAGTTIRTVERETNVYVVADVSYSANKNLEIIDEHIEHLQDTLPLNTKLGVVCFGATDSQVIHTPLGGKLKSVRTAVEPPVGVTTATVDDTSTDIVDALEFTKTLFRSEESGIIRRIVLITDAKATDESDENALKRTVDMLHLNHIYVDAIYLDSALSDGAEEVQISGVEVTNKVYQGQKVTANVMLQSSVSTRAELKVRRSKTIDGQTVEELVSSEPIEVGVGMQSLPITLDTEETGEYHYSVRLEKAEKDESPYNNECKFTQIVSNQPSTLFITASRKDEQAAIELYGEDYAKSVTLKYVDEEDVPYTVAELCKYDEIVLSDVDISQMPHRDMFVDSLETVVSLLGKSLVALGNLNLQNATDPALQKLADMLPVRYGSPVSNQKLYALVLDMSNSMELVGKMHIAKRAAKQLLDLLEDTDFVTVVEFYGDTSTVHKYTAAADREIIKKEIDELDGKHGTVISGGLNGAMVEIQEYAKEMQTQVFLITDGANTSSEDWTLAEQRATSLRENFGATTSVLAIQPQTTAQSKLQRLVSATIGNGKYWAVEDDTQLDEGVFVEIANDFGEVIIDRFTTVNKEKLYDDVLKGIEDTSFVKGYVASRAKANATTVLSAEHQRLNAAPVTVPIYSYWDYGNGKAVSFLSSFSGTWIEKWNQIGLDKQFFGNVFDVNTPVEKVEEPFITTVSRQSGTATVEVRPAQLKAGATVDVALVNPLGERTEINNVAFDSNVYVCAFALPLVGNGEYRVEVTYSYKGESYTSFKPITVSYPSEYDNFTAFDASPLYKAIASKGTVVENEKLEVVNDASEVNESSFDLTGPLLIAAVVLFAIDIVIRKLKWADIRGLFRKTKKGGRV